MITLIDNEEMNIQVSESFTLNKNTPDSRPISDYILEETKKRFDFYRKLFNVEKLEKINFEMSDDLEEWRKVYRERFEKEPPEYSRGYFRSRNNISSTIQSSNPSYNSREWYKTLCTNSHEAFHLYYKLYVYGNERIIWFDEGLAQYLSGESDWLINDRDTFKEEFIKFYKSYTPINNLNERIQGNSSVSDDLIFKRANVFDGYKASFFCISYIVEKYGKDYLIDLMKDNKRIKEVGNTILDEMINYYCNSLKIDIK